MQIQLNLYSFWAAQRKKENFCTYFFKSNQSDQGSQVKSLKSDLCMNKDSQRPAFDCIFIIAIKQTPPKSTHFTPIHHTKPMCRKRAKDEDILEKPYSQTSQQLHTTDSSTFTLQEKAINRAELNLKTHGRLSIANSTDRWAGIQTQDNKLCINLSIHLYIFDHFWI